MIEYNQNASVSPLLNPLFRINFLILFVDEIKSKGIDKVSPQELYENMSIKAKCKN